MYFVIVYFNAIQAIIVATTITSTTTTTTIPTYKQTYIHTYISGIINSWCFLLKLWYTVTKSTVKYSKQQTKKSYGGGKEKIETTTKSLIFQHKTTNNTTTTNDTDTLFAMDSCPHVCILLSLIHASFLYVYFVVYFFTFVYLTHRNRSEGSFPKVILNRSHKELCFIKLAFDDISWQQQQ